MSATHFSFGRDAVKSRCSRSRARSSSRLVRDRRALLLAAQLTFEPFLAHHAGRPGRGRPRRHGGAAPSTSCGRRRRAGSPRGPPRSADEQLSSASSRAGRLPGPARVVRAHRHAQRAADRLDPEGLPPLLHVAGHLRRVGSSSVAKYDGRVLQDRVRAPQLEVLLAQPLQLLTLLARQQIAPAAAVGLRLPHPLRSASLWIPRSLGDLRDRALRLEHEPHRTLTQLIGYFLGLPSQEHLLPPGRAWLRSLQESQVLQVAEASRHVIDAPGVE